MTVDRLVILQWLTDSNLQSDVAFVVLRLLLTDSTCCQTWHLWFYSDLTDSNLLANVAFVVLQWLFVGRFQPAVGRGICGVSGQPGSRGFPSPTCLQTTQRRQRWRYLPQGEAVGEMLCRAGEGGSFCCVQVSCLLVPGDVCDVVLLQCGHTPLVLFLSAVIQEV